jgi:homoserine O-acetyltransferase
MSTSLEISVTGAWLEGQDPGNRKFHKIGNLKLETGFELPEVIIAYQTWGKLNADRTNAILINHALTGWSDVPAWWPSMVGPGMHIDTEKYFVICPNVIGGCQGSTGPSTLAPDGKHWGSRFPSLTVRDLVNAEKKLADKLQIKKFLLAVGPSLGGMRSLEWAISFPKNVAVICTIGSSALATGDQIGLWSTEIQAIKSDPNYLDGDYYSAELGPKAGMGIARKIAHLSYRTEYEMDTRFGRNPQGDDSGRFAINSYLDYQAEKLQRRFDANTYIALENVMISHDVGRNRGGVSAALSKVEVPIFVVSIDTDRLFPPRLQEEIVRLSPSARPLKRISSPFGHDGFLIEVEKVGAIIREALSLATAQL